MHSKVKIFLLLVKEIVNLASTEDKITCFKTSSKLTSSDIYSLEDISKDTLAICSQKLSFFNQIRDEGFVVSISGVDVVCKHRHNRPIGGGQKVSSADE